MCDAECVPEHNVGVRDVGVRVRGDPGWETARRLARGLRHVTASGVNLVIVV